MLFSLFKFWESLQETRNTKNIKRLINWKIYYLLSILVYFPIAFLQLTLPLLFIISKILYFRLISVVSINGIAVSGTFIVYDGSAFHILKIIVHVYVSLWVSNSRTVKITIHLTWLEKCFVVFNTSSIFFIGKINALFLNKAETFTFNSSAFLGKVSKSFMIRFDNLYRLCSIIIRTGRVLKVRSKWRLIHFIFNFFDN